MDKGKKIYKVLLLIIIVLALSIPAVKLNTNNLNMDYEEQKQVENNLSNLELEVKDKQKDGITLSWDNMISESNNVSCYKVYMNNEYICTTNDSSYTFSNLESNKDYNFSVEFLNEAEEVILKKEINTVQTAKVIEEFIGDNVYPKDTYYIKADTIRANNSARFEAGCVLKFESKTFSTQGNFEIEGTETERTIIANSNYNGNYVEENSEYLFGSLYVSKNTLYDFKYVDFLCENVIFYSISSTSEIYSVKNCKFAGYVKVESHRYSDSNIIFENNELANGSIISYSNELSIRENNIQKGCLNVKVYEDSRCNISDNYGINDEGAILNLSLSAITSEQYLQNVFGINKNNSTSSKSIDVQIDNFPVSDGTLNLPKANYLFYKKLDSYSNPVDIKCNLSVEAGATINLNRYIDVSITKKLELNGTAEDRINIICYEKNYSDTKVEKWGRILGSLNGEIVAKYTNIKDSGNYSYLLNSRFGSWLNTYAGVYLENVEVTDNSLGIGINNTSAYIKNCNLMHDIGGNNLTDFNIENSTLKNVTIGNTTNLNIVNSNLQDIKSSDILNLKIENCDFVGLNVQNSTTLQEVNNTVLLDNNIDKAIEYTPNIFSMATIKGNNIKEENVAPLKIWAENTNEDIFDNISDNYSPNVGNYTGIELNSIPNLFTLKKGAYYFNIKTINGILNVNAGTCIKTPKYGIILNGTLSLNGTAESNIIISSAYDNGLTINQQNVVAGTISTTDASNFIANYVNVRNGLGYIDMLGNIYFDNVVYDTIAGGNFSVYTNRHFENGNTISIKNSKFSRINMQEDGKRNIELINNEINSNTSDPILIKYSRFLGMKSPIIQDNVINGSNYPITLYIFNGDADINGELFKYVSNNHNIENLENDYIYIHTVNSYKYSLYGKFSKNNYLPTQFNIDKTCEFERGSKIKIPTSDYLYGNLILNGSEEDPITLEGYLTGLSVIGTLIANHVNFVNFGSISVYDKIFMINSDFASQNNGQLRLKDCDTYCVKYNYLYDVYGDKENPKDLTYNYWGDGVDPETLSNSDTVITKPYNTTFLKTDFEIGDFLPDGKIEQRTLFGINGVNGYTGNYSTSYDDFNFKLDNIDFNLSYTYNSQNSDIGLMGKGWNFGASSKIESSVYDSDKKYVFLPNGSVNIFTQKYGTNEYECINSRNKLIKNNNEFELVTLAMTRYVYNANGYLYKVIDKYGNQISLNVDEKGKISKIITCGNKEYSLTYENDKISKIIDPIGRQALYMYDSNGLLSQVIGVDNKSTYFSYDSDGYLISIIEENDNNKHVVVNEMTYQGSGDQKKLNTLKDVSGKVDTYTYSSTQTTITDQNSRVRKETYNDKGYPIATIEPNNLTTAITYSNVNEKTMYNEISSKKDITGKTTSYIYDANGNVINETIAGKSNKFVYNDKNSVISKKDANSNEVIYEYAEDGVTLLKEKYLDGSQITYEYDSNISVKGLPSKKIDGNGNATTYEYDASGNKISETDACLNKTSYTYNNIGWLTSKTLPNGNVTNYEYDSNGNTVKITEDGKDTVSEYNYKSNKTKEIDRNSNQIVYEYDDAQNLIKQVDKVGAITACEYDIYNNKVKETKPNGAIYIYEYDNINRNIKTSAILDKEYAEVLEEKSYVYAGGSKVITTKKYQDDTKYSIYVNRYNANDDITSEEIGTHSKKKEYSNTYKLLSETDEIGKRTYYNYDSLDRLIKKYEEVETDLYKITKYVYDNNGNVIEEYTSQEKVANNKEANEYIVYNYEYDSVNNLIRAISTSGEESIYTYDSVKNKIQEKIKTAENKYSITDYSYNYAGKVTLKTEHVDKDSIYDLENVNIDENGHALITTSYAYDEENNLTLETAPDSLETKYIYDANGRQTGKEIEDIFNNDIMMIPMPYTENTIYDESGNIISKQIGMTFLSDNYQYNKLNQNIRKSNKNFIATNYEYDLLGNLVKETQYATPELMIHQKIYSITLYEYNEYNQKIKKIETLGEGENATNIVTNYEYDNCGNLLKESIDDNVTVYAYNKSGKITKKTDANGNSTKYEYDAMQNVTKIIDAKDVSTNYIYDERNNITKVDIAGVVQEESTYNLLNDKVSSKDELGNEIVYTYNNRGDEIKTTEVDSGYEVESKYYKNGKLALKQDNCDLKEKYEYNFLGYLTKEEASKSDNSEKITIISDYADTGEKTRETDGNNNTTNYGYDGEGNLTRITYANGNATIYEYDAIGNKISETDHLGNKNTYIYDSLGRIVEKRDAYDNVIEKLEYDNLGRQIKSIDTNGNSKIYEYDNTDNVVKITDELSNVETFEYDKNYNKTKYVDKNGNVTTYEYDNKNNLVKVINALGETTSYTYDNAGNITSIKDGKGNITRYEYDKRSNETKKIDQLGNEEVKTYDKNSNVLSITTNNNDKFEYEYDVHGRMIKEICNENEVTTYSYDNNDNIVSLGSITGNITKTYDNLDRVTKVVSDGKEVKYEYYDNEKTIKVIDSSGNIKVEKYDKEDRLQKVIENEEETEYTYNANGSLSKVTNAHNETKYEYYKNNLLKSLTTKDNGDNILTSSQYEYDQNSNITKEITNEKEKSYTYDKLNRINTVSNGTSYTYDKAGNIQTKTTADGKVSAYNYNAKNELTSVVTQKDLQVISQKSFEYDKNGNQIKENESGNDKVKEYVFNTKNELEEVKQDGKTIERYKYDAEGKRVQKETKNEEENNEVNIETNITKYVYDQDKVIQELDEKDEEKAKNTYGLSLIKRKANCIEFVEPEQETTNTVLNNLDETNVTSEQIIQNTEEGPREVTSIKTGYYLYNGHGDVVNIVDNGNNILNVYEYDEFGQVEQESENLDNVYKYAGYIQDVSTQNYYLNARYYNPAIQRFISQDTVRGNIEDPLSLNLYTYTHNNPLIYVDPDGHSIIGAALAFIGSMTFKDALVIGGIAATAIGLANMDYTNLSNSISNISNALDINNITSNVADAISSTPTTDLYTTLETQINTLKQSIISDEEKSDVLNNINTAVKEAMKDIGRENSQEYDHSVYVLVDTNEKDKKIKDINWAIASDYDNVYDYKNLKGKKVKYVGRTIDPVRRENEHLKDEVKGKYKFVKVASNLSAIEAKAFEEVLILIYGMNKDNADGQLVNKRNEIGAKNKNGISYMDTLKNMFKEDEVISIYNRLENEYFYYKEIAEKNLLNM